MSKRWAGCWAEGGRGDRARGYAARNCPSVTAKRVDGEKSIRQLPLREKARGTGPIGVELSASVSNNGPELSPLMNWRMQTHRRCPTRRLIAGYSAASIWQEEHELSRCTKKASDERYRPPLWVAPHHRASHLGPSLNRYQIPHDDTYSGQACHKT